MSTFNVKPKRKTGELLNEVEVQALIHKKPVIEFEVGEVVFSAQLDPNQLTSAHNNRIQAVQFKLAGILSSSAKAVAEMTPEELRDRNKSLAEIDIADYAAALNENDAALTERAAAVITDWNYPEPPSVGLLLSNANLGDAVVLAVNAYLNPTSAPSEATGETKQESGAAPTTKDAATTPATLFVDAPKPTP